MSRQPRREPIIRKAAQITITANILLLIAAFGISIYLLFNSQILRQIGLWSYPLVIAVTALFCIAILGIRDARFNRRMVEQIDAMNESLLSLQKLNNTLRAQRHDFLNHLQVVFSLMEMAEYQEATAYIEKVYGNITSVSRVLKTAQPAINALLQVKLAACEKQGIQARLQITSSWKELPMQSWEMCKILSNLIDNAMDALEHTPSPVINISLTQDLHSYRFTVANNGPMIEEQIAQNIFLAGFTTKAKGHGMGLYIVRETLQKAGGDLSVESNEETTSFSGWIPKTSGPEEP